jgi:glycosyltransferase involved in cell wall biosynthesis
VLPNDEAGVSSAIATVLDDEGPRRRMRDAGLRRAAKFS